jgi:hypothetical protein
MGWTFTFVRDKAAFVRDRVEGWETINSANETVRGKCLDHSVRGNSLWTLWQTSWTKAGEEQPYRVEKWIGLDRIASDKKEGWGYKDMEESMHPYYYDCPLKFLEQAPEKSAEWRAGVRAYHAAKKAKRRVIQVGDILKLKKNNDEIEEVTVSQKRGKTIIAIDNVSKRYFKIARNVIAEVIPAGV